MLDIVILAAGMGTRMKSEWPKVVHPVAGRPMIAEVVATAQALDPHRLVVVVGHGADRVRALLSDEVQVAVQAEQLGTGHAVQQASDLLSESGADTVLVLYGDTPLITAETLRAAVSHHAASGAAVTLLTFLPEDATGYGRVLRDESGRVRAIVEHKEATEAERAVRESNSGIMLFNGPWLWATLPTLTLSAQGEYYLTDLPALAVAAGRTVEGIVVAEEEVMGVNDRLQLAEASRLLWDRRRQALMRAGVTLADPQTLWLDAEVEVGPDTIIHPNVVLRGATIIGPASEIGPHVVLDGVMLPLGSIVAPFEHLK